MKKILYTIVLFIIAISVTITSFTSCGNLSSSETKSETKIETIKLSSENFYQYFDVSVEYYNYKDTSSGDTVVVGVYLPPLYTANALQRVKITPKSNVASCENVVITHSPSWKTCWTYDASNKGDGKENQNKNDWEIYLHTDGIYDDSKAVYYYDLLDPPSCPVPSSKLISLRVSETVTLK